MNKKFQALQTLFSNHLYLDHEPDFLKVIIATIISNRLDGESVWLLILAPPSSGKGMVSTLSKSHEVIMVSTLTPNSLISGARNEDTMDGKDPSLLPKLNGKTMVIKDASTISDMNPSYKAQIFSQLRSAYDGDVETKHTGVGTRSYSSKFGIIIAGTPDFEHSRSMEGNLGERFIHFKPTLEKNSRNIWNIISRGTGKKKKHTEMCDAIEVFLKSCGQPPEIQYRDEIFQLAKKLAVLRAGFKYDRYTREVVSSPIIESPFRVAQQFCSLYTALAYIDSKKNALTIIRRMVVDSIPGQRYQALHFITSNPGKATTTGFSNYIGWGKSTVKRVIKELKILQVITEESAGREKILSISDRFSMLFKLTARY